MFKSRYMLMLSLLLVVSLLGGFLLGCGDDAAVDEAPDEEPVEEEPAEVDDGWPEREIRVIVPFDAGGGTDTTARQMQPYVEEALGVPLAIDNRGGGNTIIGTELMVNAEADGYTIGMFAAPHFDFSVVTLDAPYDLDDFAQLGMFALDPGIIRIHNDEDRFRTLEELIDYARDNPGEVTFSVSSVTSSNYLGLKLIEEAAGVEFNIVAFDGGNPARVALAGRHVDATHAGVFNSLHVEEDTFVIAVHYNENLWPEFTDEARTVNEILGQELSDTGSFYFAMAPVGVKENYPERYQKLVDAFESAMNNPEFRELLAETGDDKKYIYTDPEGARRHFGSSFDSIGKYREFFE